MKKYIILIILFMISTNTNLFAEIFKYQGTLIVNEPLDLEGFHLNSGIYLRFNVDPRYEIKSLSVVLFKIEGKDVKIFSRYLFSSFFLLKIDDEYNFKVKDRYKLNIKFEYRKIESERASSVLFEMDPVEFNGVKIELHFKKETLNYTVKITGDIERFHKFEVKKKNKEGVYDEDIKVNLKKDDSNIAILYDFTGPAGDYSFSYAVLNKSIIEETNELSEKFVSDEKKGVIPLFDGALIYFNDNEYTKFKNLKIEDEASNLKITDEKLIKNGLKFQDDFLIKNGIKFKIAYSNEAEDDNNIFIAYRINDEKSDSLSKYFIELNKKLIENNSKILNSKFFSKKLIYINYVANGIEYIEYYIFFDKNLKLKLQTVKDKISVDEKYISSVLETIEINDKGR